MASNFPKLPGFVPTHDPTIVDHKKISHVKLEQIRNPKNQPVPLYDLPRPPQGTFIGEKTEESKSFSQSVHGNHFGPDIQEQFEPTYSKLDKQVSLLFQYNTKAIILSIWINKIMKLAYICNVKY